MASCWSLTGSPPRVFAMVEVPSHSSDKMPQALAEHRAGAAVITGVLGEAPLLDRRDKFADLCAPVGVGPARLLGALGGPVGAVETVVRRPDGLAPPAHGVIMRGEEPDAP